MANNGKNIIELRDLKEDASEYEYHLNENFFKSIEESEIEKGEIEAKVQIKKTAGIYHFDFEIKGYVIVECDRCLEDMEQPIDTRYTLTVRYGEERKEEDNDLLIVTESDDKVDIGWYIYESTILNIPMRHVHPEGKCNKEMEARLAKMAPKSGKEKEDDETEDTSGEESTTIDPRWEALKKLKNNN